jgi:hypothetical protein
MSVVEAISIVESVEAQLNEADRLLEEQHPEMAVVRAVGSFELFMKRAFIEPYLRTRILRDDLDLGDLISEALLGPTAWRGKLPRLLKSCWQIDVSTMSSWSALSETWTVRNQIIHKGESCTASEASRHIGSCRTLMQALLIARAENTRGELDGDPASD